MKKSEENTIHIRFENSEAVLSKKDLLFCQMTLLRIAKAMKDYKIYKIKELEIRLNAYRRMKELSLLLGRLQKVLPKPKIPGILEKEKTEEKESKKELKKRVVYERSIEEQLKEIESRLNELQNQGF